MIKPKRKLWRLLGLAFPVAYLFIGWGWIVSLLAVFAGLFLLFDMFRLRHRNFNRKFFKKYSFILKDSEREKIMSATWFLIGSLITVIFFDKNIAVLAIFFSNLGNVAAVFAGRLYGKFSLGRKNVEGSLGMIVVCVVIGLVAYSTGFIELGLMLVGAFAATLTELFSKGPYDNLTVPVVSALIMSFV